MAEQQIKPVGYNPNGWWMREIFIDDEGNVFEKGKLNPELKGKHKPSRITDKEPERETEDEGKISEKMKNDLSREISDDVIKALEEKFDEKWQVRENKLREEFQASLTSGGNAGITYHEMARAIATAESYRKGEKMYSDIKDIDPKDYDSRGATFTCYGNGYLIVDDVRQGNPVRTPYNRIFKFKFQGAKVTIIGRTESYSSFCSFRTNSKKEIAWMRAHTLYNIEFFEDTKRAMSVDAQKAQITVRIVRTITALDQPEILRRAKSLGISLGGDIRIIIGDVACKLAEQQIEASLQVEREKNISAFEDKTFAT